MSINQVTIKNSKVEGRMIVEAPFNAYFVEKIKRLGINARWNAEKKFWGFDAQNGGLEKVEALVIDAYADTTPRTGSKNGGRLTITYSDGSQRFLNHETQGFNQAAQDRLIYRMGDDDNPMRVW